MNPVQFFMVKFQYVSITYRKKIIEEKLKSSEESYLSHFQVWFCTSRLRLVCVLFFFFVLSVSQVCSGRYHKERREEGARDEGVARNKVHVHIVSTVSV